MPLRTLVVAAVLVCAGCAPARESSLNEIVTVRTYRTSMDEMGTALRFFCQREGFTVSIEQSTIGNLLASRVDRTMREEETRKIILRVTYSQRDTLVRLDAHFLFANTDATLNRSDEHMLIDYYHQLFDFLEDRF